MAGTAVRPSRGNDVGMKRPFGFGIGSHVLVATRAPIGPLYDFIPGWIRVPAHEQETADPARHVVERH